MKRSVITRLNPFLFLFLLASLTFVGCTKQTAEPVAINQTQQVSLEDIKNWADTSIPKFVDPPQLVFDLAQKNVINGQSYIRVPTLGAGSDGSFFYFTKSTSGKLQALYVLMEQKDKTKLDGLVGVADFEHKSYTIATYKNDTHIAFYQLKDASSIFNNALLSSEKAVIKKQVTGGCDELNSIIRLPNGKDTIIVKKAFGGCAFVIPRLTFFDMLINFFSDFGGGIASYLTGLFTPSSGFGFGAFSSWNLSNFTGGPNIGTGNEGGTPNGWVGYDRTLSDIDPVPPFVWNYLGDDGTTFTDSYPSLNPNFQFMASDNYETLYPKFTNMVKNLKTFVVNNPKVLNALQKWSNLSKDYIINHLTFGQGAIIKIEEMYDRYGYYNKSKGTSTLHISLSDVQRLENSQNETTKATLSFLLSVSILHEFCHYGTAASNISEGQIEFGDSFEKQAFNIIVNNDTNAANVLIRFKKYF